MRQWFTLLRGTLVAVMAMILCSMTVSAPAGTNQTEQSVNDRSNEIVLIECPVVLPSQTIAESKAPKEAPEESVLQVDAFAENNNVEATVNIMASETEFEVVPPQSNVHENASPTNTNANNELYPHLSEITEKSETEARIRALFGFFMSEGFSAPAAAGVIGNIAAESSFDPTVVSITGYHGLCQWNTSDLGGHWWDGKNGIREWLFVNGYTETSFEGQAMAIIYCSNRGFLTDERLEELKKMESAAEAAEYFCRYYEVGAGTSVRINEAIEVLRVFEDPTAMYAGERPYVPK